MPEQIIQSEFDHRTLAAALRQDLSSFIHKAFVTVAPGHAFIPNWHLQAIAWRLQQCLEGGIKRLIITMPPRSLKSICASVAFPAWALGKDPSRRIICASYSAELAAKHARDCKAVMASGWYREVFAGARLSAAKSADLDFETTRRGSRLATSVGGTLTGRGGSLIIIDDPIKPGEATSEATRRTVNDWYDNTLYSRLDNKAEDVIIIVMQRVHIDDLVAHVLDKEDWVHLDLPAIAEVDQVIEVGPTRVHYRKTGEVLHFDREPLEVLDKIKANTGAYNFSAQYQQSPVPIAGNLIQWEWFRRYQDPPRYGPSDMIVQSWDTATKNGELNDYSVCTTWHVEADNCYLLDVVRERLSYPDLKKRVIVDAGKHRATVLLIEDKGSGSSLIQDLRGQSPRPIAIKPEGDKAMRMSAQSAKIEAGHVLLPERARWLEEFRTEMLQFPECRYDDQVDSVSQFLAWYEQRRRPMRRVLKLTGF